MTRSSWGIRRDSALSSVVLPPPVPPETAMFLRARTAQLSSCAISGERASISTSSASVNDCARNLRMVSVVPLIERGGMTTLTRWPSGKRAFTMWALLVDAPAERGDDSVDDEAQLLFGVVAFVTAAIMMPSRSKKTERGPLTMISVTESSLSIFSMGPRPSTMSSVCSMRAKRSISLIGAKSWALSICSMEAVSSRRARSRPWLSNRAMRSLGISR